MQSDSRIVVVLGTGGTIAGSAASADDNVSYRAATLPVAALLATLDVRDGLAVESEQVAQLDSKDMDFATWRRLAARVAQPPRAAGGRRQSSSPTAPTRSRRRRTSCSASSRRPSPSCSPAAMRPATSRLADGPQNLADAVAVATAGARGVVVVVAGAVHSALDVRKVHPYRLDAFGSGDAGPIARVEEGRLRLLRPWPADDVRPPGVDVLPADAATWPLVGIVTSFAGADAKSIRALVDAGVAGIVVAATGNGRIHATLEAPLRDAMARGVAVLRSTRCLDGAIVATAPSADGAIPSAGALTPQQARVELIVRLLERR